MKALLLCGCALYLTFLFLEARGIRRNRRAILHVVHVNGTRGKSSVCRLIAAGLTQGGLAVLCKTTGTLPRVLHPDGRETDWPRHAPPTIHEQVDVLRMAAMEGAQVLVIECMAVHPEYQRVSERSILRADIGVITNVRPDHAEEMGDTPGAVARSLAGMIPRGGALVTAEQAQLQTLAECARGLGAQVYDAPPVADAPGIDHPDNVAIALRVCGLLGVPKETALQGMRTLYRRDPYAQQSWQLPGGGVFVNLFAANDPVSTTMNVRALGVEEGALRTGAGALPLVLLLNMRADRPDRTRQMLGVIRELTPRAVWLLGKPPPGFTGTLARLGIPCQYAPNAAARLPAPDCPPALYCGIGNLKGPGRAVIDELRKAVGPGVS